jgi:hypothetical protein
MAISAYKTPYKPRKRVNSPEKTLNVRDIISRGEAASFISEHTKPTYENRRAFRNKVAGRITSAVEAGRLTIVEDGLIFGDLMAWAKGIAEWSAGLDKFPHNVIGCVSAAMPTITGSFQGHSLPASLDACHQRLIEVETRLIAAEDELAVLLPLAKIGRKMKRPKKK